MAGLFRILSIDGGGIRGVIPAAVLVALERKLQDMTDRPEMRLADAFDLIAGTSSGGMYTCVYLCPSADGRPRFSAGDALELYFEHADEIFHSPVPHTITSPNGTLGPKYPAAGLESTLRHYFADQTLDQLLKPCLITAYDVEGRSAWFFRQQRAANDPDYNFLLSDVARATSAAPTFFECASIESRAGRQYALVDGGVFANNPALCAYADARALFGQRTRNLAILSIGSGSYERPYRHEDVKGWGLMNWARPLFDIMTTAVAETVDFQLAQIFSAAEAPKQYLRIQPSIAEEHVALDNTTRDNLSLLRKAGEAAARTHEPELAEFIGLLLRDAVTVA